MCVCVCVFVSFSVFIFLCVVVVSGVKVPSSDLRSVSPICCPRCLESLKKASLEAFGTLLFLLFFLVFMLCFCSQNNRSHFLFQ